MSSAQHSSDRLPDGGPVYAETNIDQLIVEPFNAATALVFLFIALYWAAKLRGQYTRRPFLSACLPILGIGGMGGTLFHGLRSSPIFLYMDVLPIYFLCLAASLYLWRMITAYWPWLLTVIPLFFLAREAFQTYVPAHLSITLTYLLLVLLILMPLGIVLRRTNWNHGERIAGAFLLFAAAITLRWVDLAVAVPMGTHWLWHLLGAGSCTLVISYFYHLPKLLYQ